MKDALATIEKKLELLILHESIVTEDRLPSPSKENSVKNDKKNHDYNDDDDEEYQLIDCTW